MCEQAGIFSIETEPETAVGVGEWAASGAGGIPINKFVVTRKSTMNAGRRENLVLTRAGSALAGPGCEVRLPRDGAVSACKPTGTLNEGGGHRRNARQQALPGSANRPKGRDRERMLRGGGGDPWARIIKQKSPFAV